MKCVDCKFFDPIIDKGKNEITRGECRKYPPKLVTYVSGSSYEGEISTSTSAEFPEVGIGTWCGEGIRAPRLK